MTEFSEASHLTDAVLVVEDKQLHVSKTVLSLASPVFDRMFHGDFKEGKTSEIPLPGKKYDHVVEVLSCIYPSSGKTVTRENMDIVMPLAEEYQVTCVKDACDTLIETILKLIKTPASSELVHLMYVAGQYGLQESKKKCIDVASTRKLGDLQKVAEFEQVDPEMKYRVSSRRLLKYEDGCVKIEHFVCNSKVFKSVVCDHSMTTLCARCRAEEQKLILQQLKKFHN